MLPVCLARAGRHCRASAPTRTHHGSRRRVAARLQHQRPRPDGRVSSQHSRTARADSRHRTPLTCPKDAPAGPRGRQPPPCTRQEPQPAHFGGHPKPSAVPRPGGAAEQGGERSLLRASVAHRTERRRAPTESAELQRRAPHHPRREPRTPGETSPVRSTACETAAGLAVDARDGIEDL